MKRGVTIKWLTHFLVSATFGVNFVVLNIVLWLIFFDYVLQQVACAFLRYKNYDNTPT